MSRGLNNQSFPLTSHFPFSGSCRGWVESCKAVLPDWNFHHLSCQGFFSECSCFPFFPQVLPEARVHAKPVPTSEGVVIPGPCGQFCGPGFFIFFPAPDFPLFFNDESGPTANYNRPHKQWQNAECRMAYLKPQAIEPFFLSKSGVQNDRETPLVPQAPASDTVVAPSTFHFAAFATPHKPFHQWPHLLRANVVPRGIVDQLPTPLYIIGSL